MFSSRSSLRWYTKKIPCDSNMEERREIIVRYFQNFLCKYCLLSKEEKLTNPYPSLGTWFIQTPASSNFLSHLREIFFFFLSYTTAETFMKVTTQRHKFTKIQRFNQKIIEYIPLLYLSTTPTGLHCNIG